MQDALKGCPYRHPDRFVHYADHAAYRACLLSCLPLLWLTPLMRVQALVMGVRPAYRLHSLLLRQTAPISLHLLGVGTWQVLLYATWQPTGRSTLPVQDDFGPPYGTGLRLVPSFAVAEAHH